MDFIKPQKPEIPPPATGKLLIAEPFLNDPSFTRSVVFLCELGDEGTVGFMLNKPMGIAVGDLVPELYSPFSIPVFQGGPVQTDTLHIIHKRFDLLGGIQILPNIYWGGSFAALQENIAAGNFQENDLKLFAGYSGWSPGQLEQEMNSCTWLVGDVTANQLFDTDATQIWKHSIRNLGKDFSFMENLPLDPQLN